MMKIGFSVGMALMACLLPVAKGDPEAAGSIRKKDGSDEITKGRGYVSQDGKVALSSPAINGPNEFDNTEWEFCNKKSVLARVKLRTGGKVESKEYPGAT